MDLYDPEAQEVGAGQWHDPFAAALAEIEPQMRAPADPMEQALAELEGESDAWESEEEPTVLPGEIAMSELGRSRPDVRRFEERFSLVSGGPDQGPVGGALSPLPADIAAKSPPPADDQPWWMPPSLKSEPPPAAGPAPWTSVWERRLTQVSEAPTQGPESGWAPPQEASAAFNSVDPVAEALRILQTSSARPRAQVYPPAEAHVPEKHTSAVFEPQLPRTAPRARTDRRRHERVVKAQGKVYFRRRGRIATGELKDLAFTGCAVLTRTPLPPGSEIPVGLELDGMRTIRTLALVVWVRQEDPYADDSAACMGVAFTQMEEDSRRLLATFLSRATIQA